VSPDPEPLFVTLVTAAAVHHRSLLMRSLGGEHWSVGASDGCSGTLVGSHDAAEALVDTIDAAARAGTRGAVVVGVDAAIDPQQLGLTLLALFAQRHPSLPPVHLRDVITVVDPNEFLPLVDPDRPAEPAELDALATRLEYATMIVVVDPDARLAVEIAHALNPRAAVVAVDDVRAVTLDRLRSVVRPPVDDLGRAQGWMLALNGTRLQAPDGISTVVFRDPRPFHPARLAHVVTECLRPEIVGTIWRSRGLVRLASRPSRVGSWSTVGGSFSLDPTAMMSDDPETPSGQEIAFVGSTLDARRLTNCLGAALLDDGELIAGPMEWATYADPFPVWQVEHGH